MNACGVVEVRFHNSWPRHQEEVNGEIKSPVPLLQIKGPREPIDRRLGGLQIRSGCCGEERSLLLLPGIEDYFVGSTPRSLVAVATELSRLLKWKSVK
jgi:hypothetical protein